LPTSGIRVSYFLSVKFNTRFQTAYIVEACCFTW